MGDGEIGERGREALTVSEAILAEEAVEAVGTASVSLGLVARAASIMITICFGGMWILGKMTRDRGDAKATLINRRRLENDK